MIISSLRLRQFRGHAECNVEFAPGINLFHGPNGAGKTNILEAVHYLCLSKSFLTQSDQYALRTGEEFFELEGKFEGVVRSKCEVRLAYQRSSKRMFINGAPLERMADIVGVVPVVVFAPGDVVLTTGRPEERRRFLDSMLCQARPTTYLRHLMRYRRALRQRNLYLQDCRRGCIDSGLLATFNEMLTTEGSHVVAGRTEFLTEFSQHLSRAWDRLEAVIEQPTIEYSGLVRQPSTAEEVRSAFEAELERTAEREREHGRTWVGPHRDELVFRLAGTPVRQYASTGQHRSFAVALKMAEYFYLDARTEETPLLLLDDVFDTLDTRRTKVILQWLRQDGTGQSLLTSAQADHLLPLIEPENRRHQCVRVARGALRLPARPAEEE